VPVPPFMPPSPRVPAPPRLPEDPIVAAIRERTSYAEPPPTHIQRPDAHADRPFTPPKVSPIPEIPEPSLVNAARYAVRFGRARWQRRGAIKTLGAEIKQDTEALDQVLGALGRVARGAGANSRVFSAENAAIDAAEERAGALGKEQAEVEGRRGDENAKFVDIEAERNAKLVEAERMLDEAQRELAHLEGQRRSLRDARKDLERRQREYLKRAEESERAAAAAQMGDARADHRRAAEELRKEAAAIEPDRQDVDRRLGALERPINEATARLDAAKAELDAAKRSLADAREGHTHRLAELDAEQKRKAREIAHAEAEIARRLVTLGTLVNLNRIEDPRFAELYQRIDRLRGAITARTTEIEKLTAEREAYDRGTVVRGIVTIGGAFVAFIALIVILRALF
jgi:chromosome segregation ATPase